MQNYPIPGEWYQHFKGGIYEIVTLAKHSESDEDHVVYKSIPFGGVYVRPLSMWNEVIKKNTYGPDIYRFAKIPKILI